jgi:hypothetical protein
MRKYFHVNEESFQDSNPHLSEELFPMCHGQYQ